jgi:ERCC4-type nuclease
MPTRRRKNARPAPGVPISGPRVAASPFATGSPTYSCPFVVAVDSNEVQHGYHYTFRGLKTNADRGNRPIEVPLVFRHLGKGHGDYQVDGHPGIAIERKTKGDLFGSISARENFTERLVIMAASFRVSFVVVEAEISEIRACPPDFSSYPVKSVLRSIQAWKIRYPNVHWDFLPGREAAEAWTFRLLEKYWESQRTEACR